MVYLVDGSRWERRRSCLIRRRRRIGHLPRIGRVGPAGSRPVVDDQLGLELLASSKDLHEHALASAIGRNGPRAGVQVASNASRSLACFEAGERPAPRHPVCRESWPSLTTSSTWSGCCIQPRRWEAPPRLDAIEMIRSLEGMERGRYAGPVGIFDAGRGRRVRDRPEVRRNIRGEGPALRRRRARAGDRCPEDELEETRIKLQAMLSALE